MRRSTWSCSCRPPGLSGPGALGRGHLPGSPHTHRVRRLHRRQQPRAPHRRLGPLLVAAVGRHLHAPFVVRGDGFRVRSGAHAAIGERSPTARVFLSTGSPPNCVRPVSPRSSRAPSRSLPRLPSERLCRHVPAAAAAWAAVPQSLSPPRPAPPRLGLLGLDDLEEPAHQFAGRTGSRLPLAAPRAPVRASSSCGRACRASWRSRRRRRPGSAPTGGCRLRPLPPGNRRRRGARGGRAPLRRPGPTGACR